ncbi:uncharacterized protein M437DRAFT_49628 [Aureobasidium melanogenum CBS 110374]|uniref:Uncharacterized protein n=1 Tax=Aureobasidium melanogenum (strain CBS 110374) TaxID=1043003 RepID=A0A074VXK4_AURM1|nr:uncharacterized protein M437DRAFT_49628 [Aureobasidium melanogenum CBS 110374]KEQ62447.1 hypothetical protein M437DRAFT_49628 [Aureobasidium melanogenum CBS 110374]
MTSSIRASTRASSRISHESRSDSASERRYGYRFLKRSAQRVTTTTLDAFWIVEIIGVIASIACLTAIMVILSMHDGQPFSSWTFYLSLNAVVSILATASKTTVLLAVAAAVSQGKWNLFKEDPHPIDLFQAIDQASRGGMGSLRAIWNRNVGFTVSFGSCLIVMSLVFQPMIQATISNYGALSDDGPQAVVGSTSNLTGGYLYLCKGSFLTSQRPKLTLRIAKNLSGPSYVLLRTHASSGLQTAIAAGFAASQQSKAIQLEWTCQTGNCTWPLYSSLAVCSECHDVSKLLVRRNKTGWPQAYKDTGDLGTPSSNAQTRITQYSLDYAGLTIDNWDHYRNVTPEHVDHLATEYMVVEPLSEPNMTANFQDYESLLVAFNVIKANASYLSNLTMWQDARPSASECGLFLCLQVYNTSVRSGQLFENVVATTKSRLSSSWHSTEPGMLSRFGQSDSEELEWSPIYQHTFDYRTDYQLNASKLNISTADAKGPFSATQSFLLSLIGYLQGFLKVESDNDDYGDRASVAYAELAGVKIYGTSALQSLFQSTNLNETFTNVANSITSYLRNTGERTQTTPAKRWTIYYRVRWAFLILPVFVILGK